MTEKWPGDSYPGYESQSQEGVKQSLLHMALAYGLQGSQRRGCCPNSRRGGDQRKAADAQSEKVFFNRKPGKSVCVCVLYFLFSFFSSFSAPHVVLFCVLLFLFFVGRVLVFLCNACKTRPGAFLGFACLGEFARRNNDFLEECRYSEVFFKNMRSFL